MRKFDNDLQLPTWEYSWVWKEPGRQLVTCSILFENVANGAQLQQMNLLLIGKFQIFFCYKIEQFLPPFPLYSQQNGNSDILSAVIRNCCSGKEDQFGCIMLQWTCKVIEIRIHELIWLNLTQKLYGIVGPMCCINSLCFVTKY